MPAFTTLKALVSMINSPITLTNHGINGSPSRTAQPFDLVSIDNWNVPWCWSEEMFNQGQHLTLLVSDRLIEYSIWQENRADGDFIRFTDGAPGTTRYTYPSAQPARKLASNRAGTLYTISGNTEAILVVSSVSNDLWVIMYRVGGNF